jgi:hypothetical protein
MAITSSETQVSKSYTVEFNATSSAYPLNDYPDSYLQIDIYDDNDDLYHSVNNWSQGVNYPYTFNSNDVGNYTVVYTVYASPEDANQDYEYNTPPKPFTVYEYKPTFTLPTVTCAELNIPFTFYPTDWFFNSNSEYNLCPATPINNGDYQVEYKRYEFNLNTSTYDLKQTSTLTIDPADITNETEEGELEIPEMYAYEWTPSVLAMVKIVVTINNCSEFVEKATVFPVCGSWKIRRLSCGNYRIYNYKNSSISYSLYDNVTDPATLIKTEQIGPFTYVELTLEKDSVYKVTSGGVTQFIFNFCTLEECVLNMQKKILMDECFCDSCKRNKDLYQKAMRMLPLYETWKKLLDKDGVYDMQYKTTDLAGELARIYDAQELYLELSKLCEDCGDIQKKCGC